MPDTKDKNTNDNNKFLLTIITESALEKSLLRDIDEIGASGYTVMDVRGRGSQGKRRGDWDYNSNIRIDVVCSKGIAEKITACVQEKYYDNYAMVTFTHPVSVLRGEKFT